MSPLPMGLVERVLAGLAVLPFGIGFWVPAADALPDEHVVFSFADPEIVESSGLVARDGLFATINDSGDDGRVFLVDPDSGETVAETEWSGEPEDVEALASTPDGHLLVGDIGDNLAERDSIQLVRVPFDNGGEVDPTTYDLTYPDGPHDAEALLVHPVTGQVLVVAKEFIGRLYTAPRHLDATGTNRLRLLDDEVLPIATDGAFFPDGKHLVLRGYGSAAFYEWPSLDEVGEIDLPFQDQGEGIAVDEDGRVFVSSEGQYSEVLRVPLPKKLQAELVGRDRHPGSREDSTAVFHHREPGEEEAPRPVWPWAVGGGVGVVILLVLLRSLRPRR